MSDPKAGANQTPDPATPPGDGSEPGRPPKRDGRPEVPTLPLPSTWRLLVAMAAIVGFLYFMYQSYEPDGPMPEPAGSEDNR